MTRMKRSRRAFAAGAAGLCILVVAACSAANSSGTPGAGGGGGPAGPAATSSVGGPASPSPLEAESASPGPSGPAESPPASGGPAASPSLDARGCPVGTPDLAAVRTVAKAGHAVSCFGSQPLTFTAYVPATEGLGGVSAYRQTPHWLADPWWGVILQPGPTPETDQNAWLIVRLAPSLGDCRITDIRATTCPFGSKIEQFVQVTGHFDDPAAPTCQSKPATAGGPAGPSKSQMVARCRSAFVVTEIKGVS